LSRADAAQLDVIVLCEDARQERFASRLLVRKGVHRRRITVVRPPDAKGSAEAWVRAQFVEQVRKLRSKRHRAGLRLLVLTDGDALGHEARKRTLDDALAQAGMARRDAEEPMALTIPTWSIESWLWWLVEGGAIDEAKSLKQTFEREHARDGKTESEAIDRAVEAWPGADDGRPASLADAVGELRVIG
jgi:hypothetical protein